MLVLSVLIALAALAVLYEVYDWSTEEGGESALVHPVGNSIDNQGPRSAPIGEKARDEREIQHKRAREEEERSRAKPKENVANAVTKTAAKVRPPIMHANANAITVPAAFGKVASPRAAALVLPAAAMSKVATAATGVRGGGGGASTTPRSSDQAAERLKFFKTCQARIGMWQHIEVGAENVKIGALCGRGSYAEVYECRAFGGVACAVKVYLNTASAKQLKGAMREIKLGGSLLLTGFACKPSIPLSTVLDRARLTATLFRAASLDHPNTLRVLGWVRTPLQTITELCAGDLTAFYQDKINDMLYFEWWALWLLRVGFRFRV